MFFATFEGGNKKSDRRQCFIEQNKTLLEFHDWIEQHRCMLEETYKTEYIVVNINFIKNH